MQEGSLCLLGGTFDRLHAGHRRLIESCLDEASRLEVWLVSSEMAVKKSRQILDWERRKQELLEWAWEAGFESRISVHTLNTPYGPAIERVDATHIGCTPETESACESINRERTAAGLPILRIVKVTHSQGIDGKVISSSRIRNGEINREGVPWLGEAEMRIDQRMPPVLDDELKQPFGTLFKGTESEPEKAMGKALAAIPPGTRLVAVGDICVDTLVKMGRVPDIGFIDGMTKREEWLPAADLDRSGFDNLSSCHNPAGMLTADLKLATRVALSNREPTLMIVDGEEDLAPIVVHLLAPFGTAVVYGQPGKGVVLRFTEEDTKDNCRRILDVFTKEV